MTGWHLKFSGWPWWIILPLAAEGVWLLFTLYRLELSAHAQRLRRQLMFLRSAALVLLIAILMEPALTRTGTEKVKPLVAVMVDQSGSMGVKDEMMAPGPKLAEAIGLKLLPASIRPLKTNAAAQAASDANIVANAKEGSDIAKALTSLSGMSRYERATRLARQTVLPALGDKARVQVYAMDTSVTPLDLAKPATLLPNRASDFEGAIGAVARNWSRDYVGGVILLTDGRQTSGVDPAPVIRSLKARGAMVSGVLVGDPGTPPDAVVAEISGGSEVFVGENIPMSVRYRITGTNDTDWDLIITHQGKELERRQVRGTGQWQYEYFAFSATNVGIHLYQARIEPSREPTGVLHPSGVASLELWTGIPGQNVDELRNNPKFQGAPQSRAELSQLEYERRGNDYGGRVRGLLVPPISGNYVFWISSDDSSEFWISPTDNPRDKVKVASVSGFVPRGNWTQSPSQKSQSITLKGKMAYYFEILHKQGGGEDYVSVGWQLPDGTMERPIPSSRINPYDDRTVAALADAKKRAVQEKTAAMKEASLANNTAEFSVAVNQDPIKVLLVDSTPRWESRYLAAMFERDRRVNLTRRYHTIILDDKNSALLPKDQAEWDSYDMVCLGDLDTNELPPEQQKFLVDFVARRGGFLVCLAGPRGLPKAFSLGAMANLLPVRVALQSNRDQEPVNVELTPEGADHQIMRILNDPACNQQMWPLLPPLQWVAGSVVAKPGAMVLLTAHNPARTPVVALERYGAGRVFWMGTEESWRWRDRLGEKVHQTFWLQVMRWGMAGRLRGQDSRLQVGLDHSLMAPNETAELKARASAKNGLPLGETPKVRLEKLGANGEAMGEPRTLDMTAMPDAPGIWRLPIEGLEEGSWRVITTHSSPELAGRSEARDLIVRDQNGTEGLDLSGDPANLARMAATGGHQAGTMDQCQEIMRDFASKLKPRSQEHRETIRLWNSWLFLSLVVALLGLEWVLRKRAGLP